MMEVYRVEIKYIYSFKDHLRGLAFFRYEEGLIKVYPHHFKMALRKLGNPGYETLVRNSEDKY